MSLSPARRPLTPLTDLAAQDAWLADTLAVLDIRPQGLLVREHVRPWSTAGHIATDAGVFWFKAHTPVLAREAPVTRLLASLRPADVLDVVASDDERCWLVTRAAGDKLRSRIPTTDELPLLEPVLATYADLQRAATPYAVRLVEAGALDRRSDRLAGLLAEGLSDDASLAPGTAYAITSQERRRLEACVPRVAEIAGAASAVVADTIDHSDLHDANVFADGPRVTLADFGDAGVGQPFVSLVVLERSLHHRLAIDPAGRQMQRLRRAYLEPWTDVAPMAELEVSAQAVRPLGLLGRGLTWRALVAGIDDPAMAEYADGWPEYLRELLEALDPTTPSRVGPPQGR